MEVIEDVFNFRFFNSYACVTYKELRIVFLFSVSKPNCPAFGIFNGITKKVGQDLLEPGRIVVYNQVLFTFANSGPEASSITDVYFDDGALLGLAGLIDADDGTGGLAGVDYTQYADPVCLRVALPLGGKLAGPVRVTAWNDRRCLGAWNLQAGTAEAFFGQPEPGVKIKVEWQLPDGKTGKKTVELEDKPVRIVLDVGK